jgi:hypothetical protein
MQDCFWCKKKDEGRYGPYKGSRGWAYVCKECSDNVSHEAVVHAIEVLCGDAFLHEQYYIIRRAHIVKDNNKTYCGLLVRGDAQFKTFDEVFESICYKCKDSYNASLE